jgi:hypothetical protein
VSRGELLAIVMATTIAVTITPMAEATDIQIDWLNHPHNLERNSCP